MRTNIIIDDSMMSKAMIASGSKTKKETIEEALKLLLKIYKQKSIKKLRGKLKWEGNLDKMRLDI